MGKINLVSKPKKERHSQCIRIDLSKMNLVGTSADDGIMGVLDGMMDNGYYVCEVSSADSSLYYVSKETDNYVRVFDENTWKKTMHIYPFTDNATWCHNVNLFFDLMLADEECVTKLNDIAYTAIMTSGKNGRVFDLLDVVERARRWELESDGDSVSSGRRRPGVWAFVCNWVKKEAHNFVRFNKK